MHLHAGTGLITPSIIQATSAGHWPQRHKLGSQSSTLNLVQYSDSQMTTCNGCPDWIWSHFLICARDGTEAEMSKQQLRLFKRLHQQQQLRPMPCSQDPSASLVCVYMHTYSAFRHPYDIFPPCPINIWLKFFSYSWTGKLVMKVKENVCLDLWVHCGCTWRHVCISWLCTPQSS